MKVTGGGGDGGGDSALDERGVDNGDVGARMVVEHGAGGEHGTAQIG